MAAQLFGDANPDLTQTRPQAFWPVFALDRFDHQLREPRVMARENLLSLLRKHIELLRPAAGRPRRAGGGETVVFQGGEVLAPPSEEGGGSMAAGAPQDGMLLRRMTVEDELLYARLEKHKDEAFRACAALLARRRF